MTAQGITAQQEEDGRRAAETSEVRAGGRLTVARLPHQRVAAVADRLEPALGGAGYENLLVVCPGSLHFFGSGEYVQALHRQFGGWKGAALPERGFWGTDRRPLPSCNEIEGVLGVV